MQLDSYLFSLIRLTSGKVVICTFSLLFYLLLFRFLRLVWPTYHTFVYFYNALRKEIKNPVKRKRASSWNKLRVGTSVYMCVDWKNMKRILSLQEKKKYVFSRYKHNLHNCTMYVFFMHAFIYVYITVHTLQKLNFW